MSPCKGIHISTWVYKPGGNYTSALPAYMTVQVPLFPWVYPTGAVQNCSSHTLVSKWSNPPPPSPHLCGPLPYRCSCDPSSRQSHENPHESNHGWTQEKRTLRTKSSHAGLPHKHVLVPHSFFILRISTEVFHVRHHSRDTS